MTHPVEVHYREISAASDALWVGLPLGALLLCLLVAANAEVERTSMPPYSFQITGAGRKAL